MYVINDERKRNINHNRTQRNDGKLRPTNAYLNLFVECVRPLSEHGVESRYIA